MQLITSIFLSLSLIHFSASFSVDDVLEKFGNNPCIPGYIVSSSDGAKILTNYKDETVRKNENYHSILEVISDKEAKSTLSQLHELADYNKIEYKYELEKEEGPPHDRIYTVSLKLGEEKYENTGKSKKDAQRLAAALALKNSVYDRPPAKTSSEKSQNETPTVLLNNIANKLGISVTYQFLNSAVTSTPPKTEEKPLKSYMQVLNNSMNTNAGFVKYQDITEKGPFHVVVTVDKDQFFASAHTKQEAKHRAAEIALEALLSQSIDKKSVCYRDPMSDNCKEKKNEVKNPISLVFEAAQIRNMEVTFEVIAETGPAHRKEFTTQCTLGEFATQGTGSSKKESKRVSAAMMLENLPYLPDIPLENHIVGSLKNKRKSNKKKKKNKLQNAEGTISSFVNSMMETVMGSSNEQEQEPPENIPKEGNDENTETDKKSTKKSDTKKKSKGGHHYSGSQNLLLEMSNRNKFEVNFVEVGEKNGKHYTLAVLHKVPTYLCLGYADNPKLSKELAADNALQLLSKQGLLKDLKETESVVEEGECPEESVSIIVDPSGLNMK